MKLLATFSTDATGYHCHLSDLETQEMVHHIHTRRDGHLTLPDVVRATDDWAARHGHAILERDAAFAKPEAVAAPAPAWRGDSCHE